MNIEVLRSYSYAALENGERLIFEAALLRDHDHHARSYFLAVAAIEEIGKSLIAFDAQGRNLRDPAVISRINRLLGDHASKIRAAFTGFLVADPRKNVEPAVELILALQRGREPSMYTDLNSDLSIHIPSAAVREKTSGDCVRLAKDCLLSATRHIASSPPPKRSVAEDRLFALKPSVCSAIMSTEDFWWYYIARMESGSVDFAESILIYRSEFLLKNISFKNGGASASA